MLTREEKQLKEAMKILLRDGKNGRLFDAAKKIYLDLRSDDRMKNLCTEIDGVDWSENYKNDIAEIEAMICNKGREK